MSYDLVVWEGERPADDDAAAETYVALVERYLEGPPMAPAPRIRAYAEALVARWGALTGEGTDRADVPWSTSDLLEEAGGPIACFPLRFDAAEEVSAECARMAAERGLVCWDPQQDRIRPAAGEG